ncbi:MAG: hypothetical protein JNL61_17180 [Rhizobiaceae bacterium]|nr:hypothetical protein [Rhizobiaceae bacterium]
MQFRKGVFFVLLVAMLSGCGTPARTVNAVSAKHLVQVPAIIGSLKCAFAQALEKEAAKRARPRLTGKVADVTLNLQVVDTQEGAGEAKLGPSVLTLGAGGSITPFINGSVTQTNTVETVIKFRLRLLHEPQYPSACANATKEARSEYGFERWLTTVVEGLEPNATFAPAGQLDSLQFKGSFGVLKKGSGGAQFDVVFVSGKVSGSAGRNDVQSIDFTILAPTAKVPLPTTSPDDPNGANTLSNRPNTMF